MSFAKRQIEHQDAVQGAAEGIAVQVGLLQRCKTCDDVFDPGTASDELYHDARNIAEEKINAGDLEFTLEEVCRALEDIVNSYSEKCFHEQQYEKHMAKD